MASNIQPDQLSSPIDHVSDTQAASDTALDAGDNAHVPSAADPTDDTVLPLAPVHPDDEKDTLSAVLKEKTARISAACRDRDLEALADLATSEGGLVQDELRRRACTSFASYPIHIALGLTISLPRALTPGM